MSTPTTHLGHSPLAGPVPVEGGNPLFSSTPRRSVESRLERMILDDLRTATGVALPEGAPASDLFGLAQDHGLSLAAIVTAAEGRLAAEAVQR